MEFNLAHEVCNEPSLLTDWPNQAPDQSTIVGLACARDLEADNAEQYLVKPHPEGMLESKVG